MIHVAITCAESHPFAGRGCQPIEGNIEVGGVADWYRIVLTEHAWTVDADGNTYCPRHNPADTGAFVDLVPGKYRPLGDSGWVARIPEKYAVSESYSTQIEIRQQRGDDDA